MRSITFSIILFCAAVAQAATYHVATNGNDSTGDGSIGNPWQTVYRATRNFPFYLSAGDTLYVRGGYYHCQSNNIDLGAGVGNSGTSNAPIVIASYPGETAVIHGAKWNGFAFEPAVLLKWKSWWQFKNIVYSNCYGNVYAISVTNCLWTNVVFGRNWTNDLAWGGTNAFSYTGVLIGAWPIDAYATNDFGGSHFNRIINSTFMPWGDVTSQEPYPGPALTGGTNYEGYKLQGTALKFGSDEGTDTPTSHNLVQGCRFFGGGHDVLELISYRNVYRSNFFVNPPQFRTNDVFYLMPTQGGRARSERNMYGAWSARIIKPNDGDTNQCDFRNVWEYNDFLYTGPPCDTGGAFGIEMGTRTNIFRYNRIAFALAAGVMFNMSGDTAQSSYNTLYNNVIYGNGIAWTNGRGDGVYVDTNNIYSNTLIRSFPAGINVASVDPRRTNNYIVNNIIWNNAPTNIAPDVYQAQVVRTNWNQDFTALGDPLFESTNGYGWVYNPANLPDFRLKTNSPCIDRGTWLAFTVGSSNSSTKLKVDNALYFSDGNLVVQGDTIQLQGSTNTAVVITNDLVLNTLTISPALSWTNGQGVALAYGGSAPDMGAFESGVFGSPAPDPDPEPEPQSPTGKITSGSVRIIGGSWGVKP